MFWFPELFKVVDHLPHLLNTVLLLWYFLNITIKVKCLPFVGSGIHHLSGHKVSFIQLSLLWLSCTHQWAILKGCWFYIKEWISCINQWGWVRVKLVNRYYYLITWSFNYNCNLIGTTIIDNLKLIWSLICLLFHLRQSLTILNPFKMPLSLKKTSWFLSKQMMSLLSLKSTFHSLSPLTINLWIVRVPLVWYFTLTTSLFPSDKTAWVALK